MKEKVFIIVILLSIVSCQPKSNCFGGRIIIDEIETIVNYEKWEESIFKEKEGKKYIACNYPDTLIKNQNYIAILKLLKTEPTERWGGQPCEIKKLEIQNNQKFESLEIEQKTLFTGGGGKTDKDETITVGIYVARISELEIEYEFTELLDWKQKRELKGIAVLQETNNDKIQTQNEEFESAFRFVDLQNEIEILLTKNFEISQTRIRLIENDKSKISGLMYNK